jgi:hypothetical protein
MNDRNAEDQPKNAPTSLETPAKATPKPNGEAPKRSLAQKILEIQSKVGQVKKQGHFSSDMGGSAYLRIEDAVKAVGKLMAERDLILTGTLAVKADESYFYERTPHKTDKGYIANVVIEWKLEDAASGEFRLFYLPGDGYDGTDKAVYKAITGSRKYAIILIFNLAIGNDVEAQGPATFEDGKKRQKDVVQTTLAQKANSDDPKVRKLAVDALSQVEPEKKIIISRPEEYNGHYIKVAGMLAVPQIEQYLLDTDSKRFQMKDKSVYWRVPAEYERGLIETAMKLSIDIEG